MYEEAAAERIKKLGTESAFAILARANALQAQGKSIIHCEIGQPDFKTPRHIIDRAYQAMLEGYTGYSPTPGYPQVREAVAEYVYRQKGVKADPEGIVITPGGKPVMFYTMLMLVNPGDEVIYPNPGFPIYESCIRFAGGIPVPMPLLDVNDFRLDLEIFRASITPKTKLVIFTNPSNPTGGAFQKEDILQMAEILKDRPDIFILSDEIYDRLVYDGSVTSIATVPGFQDRTIILDGFSKTYAMTGWRIGYGVMHPDLARYMSRLMVNSNSCTASFTQMAAMEALTGPQDSVEEMKEAFRQRRDWLVEALNNIDGISCRLPRGAFYAFPNIESFGLSSKEFCGRLMDEAGVAAAWGSSFGSYGEGHFRFSYAASLDDLKEAVRRLEKFTRSLKA